MLRRERGLRSVLSVLPLISACLADDGEPPHRARALERLRFEAGAEVTLEVGGTGATRVLAMAPRFPVPGGATDPAEAALRFLGDHHGAFQLDAAEVAEFAVTRVDHDPQSDVRHVTLRQGGSADDFVATDLDVTSAFTVGSPASGVWLLRVRDEAFADVGTIDAFSLTLTSTN